MKISSHPTTVTVRVLDSIQLDARELQFLRRMARFCIDQRMPGSLACERLDRILDRLDVPRDWDEPVYGVFETAPGGDRG